MRPCAAIPASMETSEKKRQARAEYARQWRAANPERSRANARRYYLTNLERVRERKRGSGLARAYGLTVERWNELFAAQGGACAVCRSSEPNTKRGWHTHHCHKSGRVRGILCHHCNISLGAAKEDSARLRALAEYIDQNSPA
jgi:hypothetical protein